jgi:hypothetical protein
MNTWLFGEFADDSDDYGEDDQLPAGSSQAVLYSSDWTVETLLQQLRRGAIKLEPRFQRRDAWSIEKKSAFIESILLNLPVPQIVLAESKTSKGEFLVLDGKQRLLSLMQFAGLGTGNNNSFALGGLQFLKHLNGKRLSDLVEGSDELGQFQTFTVRSVVIRNWPSEDFLDIVFVRLNQNSVKLSPQELRAALFPGPFTDAIDEFTWQCASLQELLQTPNGEVDFRMRDMELAIRYIGFARYLPRYRGNLKRFLDSVCRRENADWENTNGPTNFDFQQMDRGIQILMRIFGVKEVARKWDINERRFRGPLNRAILDVHLYYLRDDRVFDFYRKNPDRVRQLAAVITSTPEFLSAVETTTKSISNVVTRLRLWGEALEATLGASLLKPSINANGQISV